MLKKRGLWSAMLGLGVTATMFLAACGPTASQGPGIKSGGSIVDAVSQEANSLAVGQTTSSFAVMVQATIWAPLLYTDDQHGVHAGLLKEVPSATNGGDVISGTGSTATEKITLKLRSGLKWSDGQPITSDDVAFTIKTFRDKDYAGLNAFDSLNEIDTVTTPDKLTTVVQLKDVDVAFLSNDFIDVGDAVIPQHHYASMAVGDIAKDFMPAVTSGPFTVTDRVKGDHITVKKNPDYYLAPKPYLDQITFKYFPDAQTILTSIQAKQVDTAYFLPVTQLPTLKAGIDGYKLYQSKTGGGYEALYFNFSNPILADIKVREALVWSFDPNVLINQVQHGNAVATCDVHVIDYTHDTSLIKNGLCPYGPDQKAQVDVAAAKALLDADGWTVGADGYRTKGGQTLALRVSTTKGRAYREASQELYQAAWKAIGVKITIVNFPASDFFGPILFPTDAKYAKSNDQWDIAEFQNNFSTPDPDDHTLWASDQVPPNGGSNLGYYNSSTVDDLEKQQLTQTNQSDRKATIQKIQKQILQDIPIFYLYSALEISEYNNKLHNYQPSSSGGVECWNVADWYLGAAQA
jgi:peptide/nickel transport system substrate-binding protein